MTLSQINEWLQAPRALTQQESDDLDRSIRHYPYLTPLKLIRSAAGESLLPAHPWEINPVVAATLRNAIEVRQAGIAEAAPAGQDVFQADSETLAEPAAEVDPPKAAEEDPIILPFSSEDYFRQQGVEVSSTLESVETLKNSGEHPGPEIAENPLMVMMSFADWLQHFKQRSQKEKEEDEEKRALKSHWQREKLAAALEDEEDEIPEVVFQMAVDSISREDNPASESLAEVLVKQGKTDAAIDMFRRLQLRNPAKSGYFAARIDALQKGS